jgi:Cu2+-exporting ATPase
MVAEGASEIDVSWLTGEARPRPVAPGAPLQAGSVNLLAPLRMRVEKTGEETRIGKLLQLVQDSARMRAPVVQLADRVAGIFVASVLGLAALTALLWLFLDPDQALENAMALLIVSCPCALALATPLAVASAVGRAARAGVLIKGGEALENLAHAQRIWLDKTGTVTDGRIRLAAWHGDEAVSPLVRGLEQGSSHPIARAILEGIPGDGVAREVRGFRYTVGGGVEGEVDGTPLLIGAPAFARARGTEFPAWTEEKIELFSETGGTPVVVAATGRIVAVLGLEDSLREDAAQTVADLRRLGLEVGLLSGDDPRPTRAAGRRLGLPEELIVGGATPEVKLAVVREDAARLSVVMVGDGVNDAAALTAATVGVGVHGGAEAGIAAADVYLTRPGLAPLHHLVVGARRTLRVIHRNLAFSVVYNLVGIGLAMSGVLSALAAAVLMPLSSLTVVLSSYRGRTFDAPGGER